MALGVQMVGVHRFWDDVIEARKSPQCGDLQRPVLTSGSGIDLGLASICKGRSDSLTSLVGGIGDKLWLIRYRSVVKSLILPGGYGRVLPFNSAKRGDGFRGYVGYRPIEENPSEFETQFVRWRHQFDGYAEAVMLGRCLRKLGSVWGNTEDMPIVWQIVFETLGWSRSFFALPTNPLAIDTFGRRGDYVRNSKLLSKWVAGRSVIFVDLGLLDRSDAYQYFSDMRHLSYIGAKDFSRRLAVAIASTPRFQKIARLINREDK